MFRFYLFDDLLPLLFSFPFYPAKLSPSAPPEKVVLCEFETKNLHHSEVLLRKQLLAEVVFFPSKPCQPVQPEKWVAYQKKMKGCGHVVGCFCFLRSLMKR